MTWIRGIHYSTQYIPYEKHPMMCFFFCFQKCFILSLSFLRPTILTSVCISYFESHGTLGFPFWVDKRWWEELKEQEGRGAICPLLCTHEIQKCTLTFISIKTLVFTNSLIINFILQNGHIHPISSLLHVWLSWNFSTPTPKPPTHSCH